MKYNMNTKELDGTPEELLEFLERSPNTKETPEEIEETPEDPPPLPKKSRQWSPNQIRFRQFLKERKAHYTKAGLTNKEAFRAATKDWTMNKYGTATKKFPALNTINEQLQDILKDITRHVIHSKGKMTIKDDAYALGIENAETWKRFVAEFITKSSQISQYFGMPNKFKQQKIPGDYYEIRYE